MIRFRTIVIVFVFSFLTFLTINAQEKIKLWDNTAVKAKSVILEIFLPEQNTTGVGIIVCPGGSYCWHDYETEGVEVAKWLNKYGIAAFVLRYRVQGKFQYVSHSRLLFGGCKHPDMIVDLQRAMQYVREHQNSLEITTLGLMGFSAGGHLVMSAAEFFKTNYLKSVGINADVALCPEFVAPIYPVVSMSHPDTHKRSRRALLGEIRKRSKVLRDSLSLEKHVPIDCPPVFLVNCKDDPIVKYHNSELLDSALTRMSIPHKYLQYKTGGHGFGASDIKGTPESRQWKNEFLNWLTQIGITL